MKIQKANTQQTTSHQTSVDHSSLCFTALQLGKFLVSLNLHFPQGASQGGKAKGEARWESAVNSTRAGPQCLAFLVSCIYTSLSFFLVLLN